MRGSIASVHNRATGHHEAHTNRWAAGAGGELNAHPILPQMSGAGERLTGNIVVVSVRVRPIDNKEGQPGEHREEKE